MVASHEALIVVCGRVQLARLGNCGADCPPGSLAFCGQNTQTRKEPLGAYASRSVVHQRLRFF